jgi:hypothetical protein
MTELIFSNPDDRLLSEWYWSIAEEAVANASENSPVGSLRDVSWRNYHEDYNKAVIVAELPDGESQESLDGFVNAFVNGYTDAEHLETREV